MSSGGGNQTSTTKVTYSPQEQQARDRIALGAESAFNSTSGWTPYGGAKPVGPSKDTYGGWGDTLGAADLIKNQNQTTQQANNWAMNNAAMAETNPYLRSAMDAATRPMVDKFMAPGGALSAIRNGAVESGGMGGSRQGIAEGIAIKGLNQSVLDTRSRMASDGYYKGLEAQEAAIKNQTMLNMMHQMPGQLKGQVGAQWEGYAQNSENYNAAARDWDRNYQWKPLENFANVIYGGSNGTTQTTQSVPKTDNTGQIVGALGTAAMMAMMMNSDVRLKSHIQRIGTHVKGFGIYLYKIFDKWQIGVLAQEVQKTMPEVVHVDKKGFLMVDYGALR